MSEVLPPTPDALERAARAIRDGQLVGLPTETVYGLAADGLNAQAVARIYEAKDRPHFNPLILHVRPGGLLALHDSGIIDLDRLHRAGRQAARALTRAAWPGPLTLVLPRGPAVPDLTTAGLDTVGVRAPRHPVAQALLNRVATPLAAPSANRSGRISPTNAADVLHELGPRVALILDGGPCEVGVESTVVHVAPGGELTILRPGAWSQQALASQTGTPVHVAQPHGADAPRSPGMTSRHYAPDTPFLALPVPLADLAPTALDQLRVAVAGRRVRVLCWDATDAARAAEVDLHTPSTTTSITPDGDLSRTARALYATLRDLDASGAEVLLAEPFPPPTLGNHGLAHALADRMSRATTVWSPR